MSKSIISIDVFFGSKDYEYGSSVDELASYLKYQWFEEVHE